MCTQAPEHPADRAQWRFSTDSCPESNPFNAQTRPCIALSGQGLWYSFPNAVRDACSAAACPQPWAQLSLSCASTNLHPDPAAPDCRYDAGADTLHVRAVRTGHEANGNTRIYEPAATFWCEGRFQTASARIEIQADGDHPGQVCVSATEPAPWIEGTAAFGANTTEGLSVNGELGVRDSSVALAVGCS